MSFKKQIRAYLEGQDYSVVGELTNVFPNNYVAVGGRGDMERGYPLSIVDKNGKKFFLKCYCEEKAAEAEQEARLIELGAEALHGVESLIVPRLLEYSPSPLPHLLIEYFEGEHIGTRFKIKDEMYPKTSGVVEETITVLQSHSEIRKILPVVDRVKMEKRKKFLESLHELLPEAVYEFLQECISHYTAPVLSQLQPCHGDLILNNILFNTESQQYAMLDWEYFCLGDVVRDYACFYAGCLNAANLRKLVEDTFSEPRELAAFAGMMTMGANYYRDEKKEFDEYVDNIQEFMDVVTHI